MSITLLDVLFAVTGVFLLHRVAARGLKPKLPLPPGPKGLPVIGNVHQMPTSYEWFTFADWAKKWGDIISVTLLGQTLVILDNPRHAVELLDRRSNIYSDRPVLMMAGELVGWNQALALSRYGDRFKEYRKFFHKVIGSRSNLQRFHGLVETETHKFLRRVLHSPDEVHAHIRKTAAAISLMISHGYKVQEGHDAYVEVVNDAMDKFTVATATGAFLVDILPVLRYIPQWFPSAEFQRKAAAWRTCLTDMTEIPFEFVKEQMRAGTNVPNLVSELLTTEELTPEKLYNIEWSGASLYAGGADTTVSSIHGFFLAMTLFPDAQRKAQEEIDAVIGPDRLPTLEDRPNLPYVDALVKEVFRYHPVVPMGLPHRVTQDDEYAGYLIPKDTIILANVWKFLHDPEVYDEPMTFNPSRFLASEGKEPECDPRDFCFGFGRRVCPGLLLADVSVWTSCAMTLATLDISHAMENGKVVEVEDVYLSGTISHPKPFKCSIKSRSAGAESLVLSPEREVA
ncbi:hypothetical protein EIP91_009556 [Steccherinum ochraceum]|uniref:Cytochrome P450 n=1 Tax=Steccherinum ochraceum TaxID=92696 RepID=A0A4R0RNV6_9APHY|nr:hypothetical protein EIP91_009556 [Steccherinum ochraceum]